MVEGADLQHCCLDDLKELAAGAGVEQGFSAYEYIPCSSLVQGTSNPVALIFAVCADFDALRPACATDLPSFSVHILHCKRHMALFNCIGAAITWHGAGPQDLGLLPGSAWLP